MMGPEEKGGGSKDGGHGGDVAEVGVEKVGVEEMVEVEMMEATWLRRACVTSVIEHFISSKLFSADCG